MRAVFAVFVVGSLLGLAGLHWASKDPQLEAWVVPRTGGAAAEQVADARGDLASPAAASSAVTSRVEAPGLGRRALQPSALAGDLAITVEVKVTEPRRIMDDQGPAFPDVEVVVYRQNSPEVALARGRTGEDGKVSFDLSVHEGDLTERALTKLVAEVVGPGLLSNPTWVRRRRDRDGTESYFARLGANHGRVQPVNVVDTSGALVPATLQVMKNKGADLEPDPSAYIRPGKGAQHDVHLMEDDEPRWIIAYGGVKGMAAIELAAQLPTSSQTRKIQTLTLAGSGRIEGVVLDAQGRPATPFQLRATLQPGGSSAEFDGSGEPLRSTLLKAGTGNFRRSVDTGTDGSFALAGLVPGTYRLEASGMESLSRRNSARVSKWRLLGMETAAVDPKPIVLRYTRPSLVVRVLQEPGARAPSLSIYRAGDAGSELVVPMHSDGRTELLPSRYAYAKSKDFEEEEGTSDQVALVDVDAGAQYVVEARWARDLRAFGIAQVPIGSSGVEVVIKAPAKSELGRLRVQSSLGEIPSGFLVPKNDRSGVQQPGNGWLRSVDHSVNLIVADALTGLPLHQQTWPLKDELTEVFACPSGPVRVTLAGLPTIGLAGVTLRPRYYGHAEATVTVLPGATVSVPLELPVGGLLQVDVRGVVSAAELGAVAEHKRELKAAKIEVMPNSFLDATRAALYLIDPSRRTQESVARVMPADEGADVRNSWPLGESHRSTVLPTGSYLLRATYRGRPPIETQVVISEGEVTPVRLDF